MDLYTLDETFNKVAFIDTFESLIWTERYADAGDVTLVVPLSTDMVSTLSEGTFLYTPDSEDVMMIDTQSVENGLLTVTGPSLTGFLKQRILRDQWANFIQYWTLVGTPAQIVSEIVKEMCTSTGFMAGGYAVQNGNFEVFPNLVINNTVSSGDLVTVAVQYGSVFDGLKTVCDSYNLGFNLRTQVGVGDNPVLTFTVYEGDDHAGADGLNPVVFEPSLDSLTDVKSLISKAGYMNVAYAWAPSIQAQNYFVGVAYATPDSEWLTGFQRRTLYVTADDINYDANPSASIIQTLLNQRAKDALANNNYVRMVDGTLVPQSTTFKYGAEYDYNLGDLILLRGYGALEQTARVTEYIRSQDATGESAYPTLTTIDGS